MQFLREKFKLKFGAILLIVSFFLIGSNLFFVSSYFSELSAYGKGNGGDMDVTILKEAEVFANFIVTRASGSKTLEIFGDGKLLFKAYKPVRYLVGKSDLDLKLLDKKALPSSQYFYLGTYKDRDRLLKDETLKVLDYESYGGFAILLLQNNY